MSTNNFTKDQILNALIKTSWNQDYARHISLGVNLNVSLSQRSLDGVYGIRDDNGTDQPYAD